MCFDAGYYTRFGYGTTLSGSVRWHSYRRAIWVDEITSYAHYMACGWHKDEVQTLNTVSRAIQKYYYVLLCYCGTSA